MLLLAELTPQDGRVLVGGQSLVPIMGFRLDIIGKQAFMDAHYLAAKVASTTYRVS